MTDVNVNLSQDPVFPLAWARLSTLLEDGELGLWASEVLAQALALDQHH